MSRILAVGRQAQTAYHPAMVTDVVIVAAGQGSRFGGEAPKQLLPLLDRPVLTHSIDAFRQCQNIRRIVIVAPSDQLDLFENKAADRIVPGGETRTASVMAGLHALAEGAPDLVLIHDAARPGVTPTVIEAVIGALKTAPAAAPALPVVDALKRETSDGLQDISREGLMRVQTPQGFHWETIRTAISRGQGAFVDDLAAVEALGAKVALVPGDERNAKITYPGDLERISRLMVAKMPPRLGTGFDVHAFEPGDRVTLCGVEIPHAAKLEGHSDADVAWHALTDAILGALALGDIGDHFPPSDPQWKGAPSRVFLDHAGQLVRAQGYGISNCDITLICEAPKVKPHREAMRAKTAEVLGVDLSAISVKATTTEGLGFTGRREGIAAQATACLSPLHELE